MFQRIESGSGNIGSIHNDNCACGLFRSADLARCLGSALKSSTVTVAPATAGYLDLFSDVDLGLVTGQRKQMHVTFSVPLVPAATATATPTPACQLIGTLNSSMQ